MQEVLRSNFLEVVARLSVPQELGFDTETDGLSEHNRLFSAIFADAEDSYHFNFQSYPDISLDLILPREWIIKLQPIFNHPDSIIYINNAKFDMSMVAKEGLTFNCRVVCTVTQERLLRNNLPGKGKAYSLENQAKRIGEEKDKSVDSYIKEHKLQTKIQIPGKKKITTIPHFDRVPYNIISKYAGHDAYLHRRIGRSLNAELRANSELDQVRKNEERLTKTCFNIERVGIRFDRDYTKKALGDELSKLERSRQAFKDITGQTYQDSKALLVSVFLASGETIPKTAKDNDSLTDAILERMKSPAARAVQRIRYHEKRIGTYYSSFMYFADSNDTIRASINQAGTETGRFSYSNPNLQNVPKEDEPEDQKLPYLIRGCFVPRPDFCFVMIDYSQQEYRMMFDYAGQKDVIKAIMGGADAHQATADILGITRKVAKNTNFAYLYGAGIDQLAKTAGVTPGEAKRLKMLYGFKFPYVDDFVQQVIKKGKERGYIRNWFGRRSHISDPNFAYILPNHLIQGGCADVVKVAMNKLDDYLAPKQSRMVLQVHDEILFEVHKSELGIVPELQAIMENIYPSRNGMKLTAAVEHSWVSWSHKDKVKGAPCQLNEKLESPKKMSSNILTSTEPQTEKTNTAPTSQTGSKLSTDASSLILQNFRISKGTTTQ